MGDDPPRATGADAGRPRGETRDVRHDYSTPPGGVRVIGSVPIQSGVVTVMMGDDQVSAGIDLDEIDPTSADLVLELSKVKRNFETVKERDKRHGVKFAQHVKAIEHAGNLAAAADAKIAPLEARLVAVEQGIGQYEPDAEFQQRVVGELAAIHGRDGKNGKLQVLRDYVDGAFKALYRRVWGDRGHKEDDLPVITDARRIRRWAIAIAISALGSICAAFGLAVYLARQYGEDAATVREVKEQVNVIWSVLIDPAHPPAPPAKEPLP